ncbi:MAG: hypothetical protein V3V31_16605 [Methylococcales bacterium]
MIEISDSKWVSLATVSILGQPPSSPFQVPYSTPHQPTPSSA